MFDANGFPRFLRILIRFLGRGGGEGGVTNVIKDSLVNNLTRATPEGCGGSKMGAKIRPKIENVGKKGVKKLMRKIDARKMLDANEFPRIFADFGSIFGAWRGEGGTTKEIKDSLLNK